MNTHNYLKISTKSIKDKIFQKVYWHHLYLAIKSSSYCTCTCTKMNNLSFWISEIYSVCRQEAYEINVKSTDTSLPSGLSPLFFIFTNKDFSKFILKYFPPNNNTKSVTTPWDTQTVNHGQIADSLADRTCLNHTLSYKFNRWKTKQQVTGRGNPLNAKKWLGFWSSWWHQLPK